MHGRERADFQLRPVDGGPEVTLDEVRIGPVRLVWPLRNASVRFLNRQALRRLVGVVASRW